MVFFARWVSCRSIAKGFVFSFKNKIKLEAMLGQLRCEVHPPPPLSLVSASKQIEWQIAFGDLQWGSGGGGCLHV